MVVISGWNITAESAEEIKQALVYTQGVDPSEVDILYVKNFMADRVRRTVADYRRYQRDKDNPVDETDPF